MGISHGTAADAAAGRDPVFLLLYLYAVLSSVLFAAFFWCLGMVFPAHADAKGYTFAVAGFGSKVNVTNAEGDAVVQVSQSISDYLIDELIDCPSMTIYDSTPAAAQARADEVAAQLALGCVPPELKAAKADYIISGYLSNMGIMLSECRFLVPGGRSYKLCLNLSVKIYESSTGRCVYTAVGNGEAASEDFDISLLGLRLMRYGDTQFSGECYDAALKKAVKQVADKIKRDI